MAVVVLGITAGIGVAFVVGGVVTGVVTFVVGFVAAAVGITNAKSTSLGGKQDLSLQAIKER